jgi:bifunctional non-homologous end joining protein LigD
MAEQPTVVVDGHRVPLTNVDKVMYPQTGTTKADVIGYYAAVSGVMIPHVIGRPATRKRWPDGVEAKPFFEKNLGKGVPNWVPRREIQHSDRLVSYPLIDSPATLVWLGQSAALELHVPQWFFSSDGEWQHPDRLVFDLDPGPGVSLAECAIVARAVRDVLGPHGSELFPVTSGSKGLHLYLGLNGSMSSDEASAFAHRLAEAVERRLPDLVVSRMAKALRPGKVFIDWSQNNGAKTTIAPYSLRGREYPMVAAPRTWDELEDPDLAHLDYQDVLDRVDDLGDPIAQLGRGRPKWDGVALLDTVRAVVEGAGGRVRAYRRRADHGDSGGGPRGGAVDRTVGGSLGEAVGDGARRGGSSRTDTPDSSRSKDGQPAANSVRRRRARGSSDGGVAADSDAPGTGSDSPIKDQPGPGAATDRLGTYRSMRSADRTPEPVPGPGVQPVGNDDTFVIQEHHARRLHWDFRLERDGVLVSWAVPRGIPTDTRSNRLAVHTEDHPLEYATFAGTIPRGEYGGGAVTIWDAGTYETEKWRDDEVIVVLHGERAIGRFALIRTEGTNWLMHLMKDQDPTPHREPGTGVSNAGSGEDPRAEGRGSGGRAAAPAVADGQAGARKGLTAEALSRPPEVTPMLASPGSIEDFRGPSGVHAAPRTPWRFEGKWDGIRAIATVFGGQVSLRSRAGNDLTAGYPEMVELAELLAEHVAVLDGEIVALGPHGVPDFSTLQRRMGLSKPRDVAAARREVEVGYYVFDVMYLDGVSLLRKPYDDRRRVLEAMRLAGKYVSVPKQLTGPASTALAESTRRGWEGIVAKRGDSTYGSGHRSGSWIKIKTRRTQDVVVVGWRPGGGRREGGLGSLLMGVNGPGGLEYVGRVGTGFTDVVLDDLLRRLKPLKRKTSPVADTVPAEEARDAEWVRPELVGEVEYLEITHEGRLRAASWRGLRGDVMAEDVHWAEPEHAET